MAGRLIQPTIEAISRGEVLIYCGLTIALCVGVSWTLFSRLTSRLEEAQESAADRLGETSSDIRLRVDRLQDTFDRSLQAWMTQQHTADLQAAAARGEVTARLRGLEDQQRDLRDLVREAIATRPA